MPAVPLGIGAYKRSGLVPEVVLRNLILEKDESGISPDGTLRIQRPGLTQLDEKPAAIRGLHYRTSAGERLTIAGDTLYNESGEVGTIVGTDLAAMVSTPFLTLIASNGELYRYDTGIDAVPLPDDAPGGGYVQDVEQLNGYGLALLPNGRFYWIVPGEIEIDALSFATAESLPDAAVAIRRLGDEFWIFGSDNVEVWQPTGDPDLPFQRAAGRNFERGCLYRDAVRRFDNTLVWIGDDYQVYRAASVPQVISNSGIAERVRGASGPCSAITLGLDGHSFYVLRIPGQGTFAYDAATQAWSEFATFGAPVWAPVVGYQVNGLAVLGSGSDGRIWRVDADNPTDDGAPIERIITGTVPVGSKPPRNDSLSIGTGATADTTIRVRWRDGQESYPDYYDELPVSAPFDVATMYRLGSADEPFRTFEISCVDAGVRLRLSGMKVNDAWQ